MHMSCGTCPRDRAQLTFNDVYRFATASHPPLLHLSRDTPPCARQLLVMNITLVSATYAPIIGGIEQHVADLASALLVHGHEVDVVCLTPASLPPSIPLPPPPEPAPQPPIIRLQQYRLGKYAAPRSLRLPASDVIHFHGFSRPLFLATSRAARQMGTPLILTPHGSLHRLLRNDHPLVYHGKRAFDALLAPLLPHLCDAVIALTAEEAAHVAQQHPGLARRTAIIGNALPTLPAATTSTVQGSSGRFLALSRLSREKRLADIVAALERDPTLPGCDIVGPEGNATYALRLQASRLAPGRINVLGPLYGEARFDALRKAVALVLPSESEMQSLSALEALAVGTPVVASQGAATGLGRGPHVVVYNTGDIDALTQALHTIAPGQARASIHSDGRTWCVDAFEMAAKTVDVYRHCIAASSGRPL